MRVSELSPEFTEASGNPPPAELLPDTARVAPVFVLVGVTNIDVISLETETVYKVVAGSNTNPEAGAPSEHGSRPDAARDRNSI